MKLIVLTFDDACKSHLDIAVPILKKYGFTATFFISRPQVWFEACADGFLAEHEIAELYKAGFELGNHTVNHLGMSALCDDMIRKEIEDMNAFLSGLGVTEVVSFAYPGGPYCSNAAGIIPEYGLKYARTTEHGLWTDKTDKMRIPCFSICNKQEENFTKALELLDAAQAGAAVILYHGVPDTAHEHCNTSPELFEKHMQILYDNSYRVISMREYGDELNSI